MSPGKGYMEMQAKTCKVPGSKNFLQAQIGYTTAEKWACYVHHVTEKEESQFWDMDDRLEDNKAVIANGGDDPPSSVFHREVSCICKLILSRTWHYMCTIT